MPLDSRAAVYTGSFDPVHLGHLDVIRRGARLYDRLIIGVGVNPEKSPFFTTEERVKLLERVTESFGNVEVRPFSGLAVRFGRHSYLSKLLSRSRPAKARTGKPAYTRKRPDGAKGFTASPWAHGDAIYCLDEDGTTFKVRAGPQFEELGSSGVEEMCWASPAVSRGALFLRGVEHLYCISRASSGR